jgi:hypothetical protein
MNKYVYGLIFNLVIVLNTSGLVCTGAEILPLHDGHRRTLSQEQMGKLEQLMETGTGKRGTRYGRSLPGSRQYDPSELEELIKEIEQRNCAAQTTTVCDYSAFDDIDDKREFHGGDFEKWKAGRGKWLERQEKRAAEKRYIEQIAGEGADEGDANLVLISAFKSNEPVISFDEYLRDEREKAAVRLLGADLYHEISGDTDRLEK